MSEEDDRAAITDVLVRYATAIDRRDWPLFGTCFTEDCTSDYGAAIGEWSNREDLTAFMVSAHANMGHTMHRMTNLVVAVDGDSGTGRTYVHVILQLDRENPTTVYETFGFYDDTFVRATDGWRIAERNFTTVAERTF
jgi:3-phenylpropionate/cinnamic acid dioxygenase small subunit